MDETQPLLGLENGLSSRPEGEPSLVDSFKWFFFSSWFNILLLFIPLSIISSNLGWDAGLQFGFSFIAIIPLAKLLGDATEQMSIKMGPTPAGLLNATFGNAVEIIVGIAALLQGQLRIVQTSMLGSILSNILLVLGCSFFAAGCKFEHSSFQETGAQASASFMTLACITLVIPAAYHSTQTMNGNTGAGGSLKGSLADTGVSDLNPDAKAGLLFISRGTAILLLFVYLTYLFFQLKTHPQYFNPNQNGTSRENNSHPQYFNPNQEETSRENNSSNKEEEPARMSMVASGLALLGVTVVTSFCADYLVASIEETAERYHIPKAFIALILLPIVGNAAEHATAITMAIKNQMEITITVCVGSSIQIAAFVVPLLVIVGWISGHDLTLFFANFETIVLFVSVLLVNTLLQDGKSNYLEGTMLVTLYIVIALSVWVS